MTEAACPICSAPATDTLRPFCSRRCADVDLGRWLTGHYRLPGRLDEALLDAGDGGEGPEAGAAAGNGQA